MHSEARLSPRKLMPEDGFVVPNRLHQQARRSACRKGPNPQGSTPALVFRTVSAAALTVPRERRATFVQKYHNHSVGEHEATDRKRRCQRALPKDIQLASDTFRIAKCSSGHCADPPPSRVPLSVSEDGQEQRSWATKTSTSCSTPLLL